MSWNKVPLSSLVELITKGTTPTSVGYDFTDNGINFIKIESINLNGNFIKNKFAKIDKECNVALKRSQLKEGDILFSIAGALGRTAIVTKEILPANTNQALAIIRLNDSNLISKEFLIRVLTSESILNQVSLMKGGVAQQNLSLAQLKDFLIPLPSLATQNKIVAKLDAIFSQIDTAKAAAEANAKNAEALFQSYLNEVFSSNENLTKLKDCTQIKPPKSEIKNLKGNTSVSFMPMESLGINDKFTISKQSKDLESVSGSYTYFTEGDVLLAKITPCFENGKLGIASNLVNGIGFGSSEYIVFRPNKIIDKEWLYYFLNRESFRVFGSQHMSGSVGHKRVTKEFVEETLIPLISVSKQKEFVDKIDNVFVQSQILKSASNTKIRELKSLKQSILQKAFSGELVKD